MSAPIRWADRDTGEKFSIIMLGIFGFAFFAVLFLDGLDKLVNGSTFWWKMSGLLTVLTVLGLAAAGIKKWSSARAR